ncbi:allophanate hydrolase [Paracoccus limosus]|uniref:Allophanate hydrolase n=1 Tax=Paracoccus limosus TaxID=913252 RepID=A0A844H577_9RHOB|nr:biotin-dependent carboxyltransferase family protein [Paracoccus limosus]MTH33657.1 allophanate hydrolase [Paracoccus limosus]
MTAVLSVVAAGPLVSVQDAGRPGLMRYGVPRSGPMDRGAFAAANLALGNPAGAPGIEVSLAGLDLECLSGEVGFALAGGGFIAEHAGRRLGSWSLATLRAGERLAIRRGPWGSWCYLAFAGQLQSPEWLGSAATHWVSGFGGGRISRGDRIEIADPAPRDPCLIPCPVQARPRGRLHVTLGPQQRFFSPETLARLTAGPWRVTGAGDRMGVRLDGPRIAPDAVLDMPSGPVSRGSIQVAGDGVATLLLADHQTTGGYPKIATVLDCDLDGFVQLRPGDALGFRAVTPEQAVALARTAALTARHWQERLALLARS